MLSVTVLPRLRSASLRLPSPRRSAASALPPLPISNAMARNTVMIGFATVAAERPISPMAWPRKMESMTLYAPLTSMPRMAGTANSVMSLGIESVPMRLTRSLPLSARGSLSGCDGSKPGFAHDSMLSSRASVDGFCTEADMRFPVSFVLCAVSETYSTLSFYGMKREPYTTDPMVALRLFRHAKGTTSRFGRLVLSAFFCAWLVFYAL